MTNAHIRLVTRGDDAGSCHSANAAILEACQEGILRNVSIMVPGPAFEEVASMLAGLPHICFGLHVTLNAEWDGPKWGPVLPPEQVPSLVDEQGHFFTTPNVLQEHNARGEEMIAEVQAQLQLARKSGLNISYLDEHMGVSWVSDLRPRLANLAAREGLVDAHALRHLPRIKETFDNEIDRLVASLEVAPPGDYVFVTHPGYAAPDMQLLGHAGLAPGQVARERDADRRLWLDARLRDYCKQHDVEIARYTDVLTVQPPAN
ncbi:MAG: ChbG/HpnK family deacetylase [Abitibacteriaceae bacterium]|nr:ChbG/HpnK family deacetylase [Abditibacteriaceae bacterium]MBV9868446.1 ChbG/HpnK family deacetylase [Abditibacteriaceae bacterium]